MLTNKIFDGLAEHMLSGNGLEISNLSALLFVPQRSSQRRGLCLSLRWKRTQQVNHEAMCTVYSFIDTTKSYLKSSLSVDFRLR